jgi:hypothetical protein
MQITLKPFSLKLRKNTRATAEKINNEIQTILDVKNIDSLIGHEILYQLNDTEAPRYTYWSKILALSPNKKFVKLVSCDDIEEFNAPYYRELSQVNIVDILD